MGFPPLPSLDRDRFAICGRCMQVLRDGFLFDVGEPPDILMTVGVGLTSKEDEEISHICLWIDESELVLCEETSLSHVMEIKN